MDRTPSVRREVRLLSAFWFLREFQLWLPVWIVYLTVEQGFSLTEVTIAESLFLVAIIVLEVPTGAVADRFSCCRAPHTRRASSAMPRASSILARSSRRSAC